MPGMGFVAREAAIPRASRQAPPVAERPAAHTDDREYRERVGDEREQRARVEDTRAGSARDRNPNLPATGRRFPPGCGLLGAHDGFTRAARTGRLRRASL